MRKRSQSQGEVYCKRQVRRVSQLQHPGWLRGDSGSSTASKVHEIPHKVHLPDTLLFPTPPLPLETTTTFLHPGTARFCGRPRCIRGMVGGASDRGRPWEVCLR